MLHCFIKYIKQKSLTHKMFFEKYKCFEFGSSIKIITIAMNFSLATVCWFVVSATLIVLLCIDLVEAANCFPNIHFASLSY